ncbi:MAG: DUF1573 domain-containing protein [Candidatus Zixiibacteriota bacterium]|nr:MAG: DUF1573 domain-containing protein [candidate division Zixibacteria bacterium]
MKETFNALIIVVLGLISMVVASERPINYTTQVFDFGHVAIDFNLFHSFQYVNDTDHPVKILEAETNCDCSTVSLSDSVLTPGDTAFIRLTFNTRDYYGATSKAITVVTDDPENTQIKYYYTSVVGQWFYNLRPNPQSLFFLPGKKGMVVRVPNTKFDKIELKNLTQYDNTFSVNVIKRKAGRGETVELDVTPADGLGRGNHLSTLTLEIEVSDLEKPTVLSLPVKIARY